MSVVEALDTLYVCIEAIPHLVKEFLIVGDGLGASKG